MANIMRVIDFETTGLEPPEAQVIEVGWCDFDRENMTFLDGGSYFCGAETNPPESRAIHHIWPEDVAGKKPFDASEMNDAAIKEGAICYVAYNATHEEKFLGVLPSGLPLVCAYKAGLRIWPDAPSHSNFGLLYWLLDQGKVVPDRSKLAQSHRAFPDAYATALILKALYESGVTGKQLVQWTAEPRLLPTCPIGAWRGSKWADVDEGFLNWILSKSDMDYDIAWNAGRELDRRYEQ